jgi:ureidoacrylate peracid hydrolase
MTAAAPSLTHQDDLASWIAPGRTALVIIDMQVDFAAPDGALGLAGVDLGTVPAALANAERLAAAARAAGVPVVFVGLQTLPATDSPAWRERMRRRGGDADAESGLCRVGTAGAAFYGPQPQGDELVVAKTRYSAFANPGFDDWLRSQGLDTLVVCGLTTECCVDSTVRDAFHLDFHVFVAADACAAYDPALHTATLDILELNCAIVSPTAQIVTAWTGAA